MIPQIKRLYRRIRRALGLAGPAQTTPTKVRKPKQQRRGVYVAPLERRTIEQGFPELEDF